MINYIKKSPHRNHLEKYLNDFLPRLNGSILDIGSKNRRYDYLLKSKPTSVDLIENIEKDVQFGDVTDLKFDANSFDNIICLEVLEYVTNIDKAISQMHRVSKDGGEIIISVPFMHKVHEDNARYTKGYLLWLLLNYFSDVKIYTIGNFYTIILDIIIGKIIKNRTIKEIKNHTPTKKVFLLSFSRNKTKPAKNTIEKSGEILK